MLRLSQSTLYNYYTVLFFTVAANLWKLYNEHATPINIT